MTHQDAQATSNMVIGMLVGSLNFDLIDTTHVGHSIVDNIMFGGCLVMIGYREMSID
ncbi:hypothetical protein CK203_046716 [Vitis vinifera]|uniref:Uncharacterized protein n=1 Tax=Vitis vinifera TaxID=29760 RepID=A0A438HJZ2_VITVI|nr:hypothetical protein CK203_046716 [Vitis vinifera]